MITPAPPPAPTGIRFGDVFATWTTRAGLRFLLITDVLMIGALAPVYLAGAGIAYAMTSVLYTISQGLLLGCLITAAAALETGARQRIPVILRDGLVFGVSVAIGFAALCLFAETLLRLVGQSAEITATGAPFMMLLGAGLPFHYAFVALGYVMEAMGRQGLVATCVAIGFGANLVCGVGVGLALSEGQAAMAVAGTTVAIRIAMLAGLVWLFWRLPVHNEAARHAAPKWTWASGRQIRAIGYAAGSSLAIEAAAFASLSVFAGWMGSAALAAFTVLNNLVSLIFSAALAVAIVTSAQIAGASATQDRASARARFLSGMRMALLLMAGLGLGAFLFRAQLIDISLADPGAAALALPLVGLVAFLMLGDGGQAVAANALRGVGDVWPATMIHLACYLILMVGGGWALAIHLDLGVRGLIQATAIASFTVLILLTWRFFRLTSHTDERSVHAS